MARVLSASTTFMVPVAWADGPGWNVAQRVLHLRHRAWEPRQAAPEVKPMWALSTEALPAGTEELSAAFRSVLAGEATGSPWAVTRLSLNRSVVDGLLHHGRLVDRAGQERFPSPRISRVDLLLLPLDVGVLSLRVDWLTDPGQPPAPEEIAHRLAQVRACRDEENDKDLAWRFEVEPSPAQRAVLGPRMQGACGGSGRIGTAGLAEWLLLGPEDDPAAPPHRTGTSRHVVHHSHLVVDGPLDDRARADLLFGLRRAVRRSQRPPIQAGPDRVLELRGNRFIGVAREGTASLGELTGGAGDGFERDTWPRTWHGHYALLVAVLRAQHLALSERAAEVTRSHLDLDLDGDALHDPVARRERLRSLAERISHQVLTLPGAEPGGTTDHAWFYRSLRDVLGIPALVEEVRDQARDLLGRAEQALEVERQQREQETARRDRRVQQVVATVGAMVLPATVISGLLGMNLPPASQVDGVAYWPWFLAVAIACALAALVMGAVLWRALRRA